MVNWAIGQAKAAGVASLLDHPSGSSGGALTAPKSGGDIRRFVLDAHDVVETLRDGTGWEVEYPRDVWRLHTLPGLTRNAGKAHDARNHLRFDRITQPWLRAARQALGPAAPDPGWHHRGHRAQRRRRR